MFTLTGHRNTDQMVVDKLSDTDLFNFCNTQPGLAVCKSENFWKQRFWNRFGKYEILPETEWKKFYFKIHRLMSYPNYPNVALRKEAKCGNKDSYRFFVNQMGDPLWSMFGAAEGGQKEMITWLIEQGSEDWEAGLIGSALGGHRDLVDYFINQGAEYWENAALYASERGHSDLVEFFIEKIPPEEHGNISVDIAEKAAQFNHIDTIKCVQKYLPPIWLNYIRTIARRYGHVEIVNYISEQLLKTRTKNKMKTFQVSVMEKQPGHLFYGQGSKMAYIFNGEQDKTLKLVRGCTYKFNVTAPSHPLFFTESEVGGSQHRDNNLMSGRDSFTDDGIMIFKVTDDMPDNFYYQCWNHPYMGGKVVVVSPSELWNCLM